MIWCKKFYCGDGIESDCARIVRLIKHKKPVEDIFVIALPVYGNNLLDIFEASELLKPFHNTKNLEIVGIASGKDSAMLLCGRIVDEVYKETGGFDVAAYIRQGQAG